MNEFTSVIPFRQAASKRDVKKVPFVELCGGRLQGVVSSGSDVKRVYVSFVDGASGAIYCCTNNNRPCGGLRGTTCKHLDLMLKEAVAQYGMDAVTKYLGLTQTTAADGVAAIVAEKGGALTKESPGVVFSRFLHYLRYTELDAPPESLPEMAWFV